MAVPLDRGFFRLSLSDWGRGVRAESVKPARDQALTINNGGNMKKLVLGLFCLLSVTAKADVWECVAAGDVVIKANNMIENVTGRIGSTEIHLFQYGMVLEGRIEGLDTIIRLNKRTANGKVGMNTIQWKFNPHSGMITGYQKCILSGYSE